MLSRTDIGAGAGGTVAGTGGPGLGAPAPASGAAGGGDGAFAATLDAQARRAAAREVLAALPPMLAQAIQRSAPGQAPDDPSLHSVGALLDGIRSGEFAPSAEQRAARTSVIGAAAQVADVFASSAELWAELRDMLGAGDAIAQAVRLGGGYVPVAAGGELVAAEPYAALSSPLPPEQLRWWEAALLLLRPELAWGEPRER
jgi:hypothetical protein